MPGTASTSRPMDTSCWARNTPKSIFNALTPPAMQPASARRRQARRRGHYRPIPCAGAAPGSGDGLLAPHPSVQQWKQGKGFEVTSAAGSRVKIASGGALRRRGHHHLRRRSRSRRRAGYAMIGDAPGWPLLTAGLCAGDSSALGPTHRRCHKEAPAQLRRRF